MGSSRPSAMIRIAHGAGTGRSAHWMVAGHNASDSPDITLTLACTIIMMVRASRSY